MVERFLKQTTFSSREDFLQNYEIKIPENFNFGYDVIDAYAEEQPEKKAICWTNDKGEHIDFTYKILKDLSDRTASYSGRIKSGTEKSKMCFRGLPCVISVIIILPVKIFFHKIL